MVIGFEKAQKEKLPNLQDRFGDSEAVQKALAKIYRNGLAKYSNLWKQA
jgi:stress response protein YsnF